MGKNFLFEIKSLINRIENPETINESKVGFRFIDKAENLPDLLAGLKPGKMFTFGYVNVAQIVVPTVKRRNPETNRMKSYEDYGQLGRNLGEQGEVVNVIKLSMYNFPWQEQKRVKERYGDWRNKREELASKFGVTYGKARYGTEMNNFGGGIESYKGNNPEISDHTYLNFNLHNIRPFNTAYYLLFDDGSIKQVDEKKLEFKAKTSYDELQKLRDAGATEEDLECLLGMDYRKFENSKILFVSGTEMDGVPTLLINDNLSDKISGVAGVNRDAILQIAKDRYSKVLNVNEGKDIIFVNMLNESFEPGSMSHGTMRTEDLIPTIMSNLFKEDQAKAREIWQKYPNLLQALCDKQAGVESDWWDSEEASEILNNDLFDEMQNYAPEGHYFGSHPGDGSDYGYWPNDDL